MNYTGNSENPTLLLKEQQMSRNRKKYTMFNFIVDLTLTVVTGGFWIIWIFCRELRSK
jgi:hypothetical protein